MKNWDVIGRVVYGNIKISCHIHWKVLFEFETIVYWIFRSEFLLRLSRICILSWYANNHISKSSFYACTGYISICWKLLFASNADRIPGSTKLTQKSWLFTIFYELWQVKLKQKRIIISEFSLPPSQCQLILSDIFGAENFSWYFVPTNDFLESMFILMFRLHHVYLVWPFAFANYCRHILQFTYSKNKALQFVLLK